MNKEDLLKQFLLRKVFPLFGFTEEKILSIENKELEKSRFCNFSNESNEIRKELIKNRPVYLEHSKDGEILHFGTDSYKYFFSLKLDREFDSDMINLMRYILMSFSIALKTNKGIFDKKENIVLEDNYLEIIFNHSIQKGICKWITGNISESTSEMEKLLAILENWSNKTYEGHNVSFGILYDPTMSNKSVHSVKYVNSFTDFLSSEYSAVLSDWITSLIRINKDCEFVKYESITENNKIYGCNYNKLVLPYRFLQVIEKNVTEQNIGIFLLNNGDIFLAKNKQIYFIKRNNKWLNFNHNVFSRIISENVKKFAISKIQYKMSKRQKLLKTIFSTTLDVSLAHTGGIISVVNYNKNKDKLNKIISPIDNIYENKDISELYMDEIFNLINDLLKDENKKSTLDTIKSIHEFSEYCPIEKNRLKYENFKDIFNHHISLFNDLVNAMLQNIAEFRSIEKDLRKRLTKRHMILKLLEDSSKETSTRMDLLNFIKIDKKLKAELIGLDGACIMDLSGEIIAFGAIIENDAGSSGGGRGAAAKKLSNFNGFSIKISTDGYIEVYVNYKKIYVIK